MLIDCSVRTLFICGFTGGKLLTERLPGVAKKSVLQPSELS
jgi:hypothetical protein